MRLLKYMRNAIEGYLEKSARLDAEYKAAYLRCFTGTPEEMERRLDAWDWAHRATRSSSLSY